MSAIRQFRVPETEGSPVPNPSVPSAPAPQRDNPLQLLRDAINQLKSSGSTLPDQEQLANLLAEAREALEHANAIARTIALCDAHLSAGEFARALEALDDALAIYPDDPILLARRRAVEEQQRAFETAAAVRGALEETQWLVDNDRADLATQFLQEKTAGLPDQRELTARLAELEALLPEWEQKRYVQDALVRAQTLEQLRQWQAALTVIQEAQQAYPLNTWLRQSAERIRRRLIDDERAKKLAGRIELIRQQIAARAWRQALTLLDNTQIEFSGAEELKPLRREITVGLRCSECEETVTEVRKYLVDGDLEQAERVLKRGLEVMGSEPSLAALHQELEAEKKYSNQLRSAQVLFGRRQFEEAERVLTQLLDRNRPEAQALLEAVRTARAASEEEDFLERGRKKALGLIQEQQFEQAADLLRNLLALFPGNPILVRDLAAAQAGLERVVPVAAAERETREEETAAETEIAAAPPAVELESRLAPGRAAPGAASSKWRRAAVVVLASLVLVSAAGVVWKVSPRAAPAARPAPPPPAAASLPPEPAVRTPAVEPSVSAAPAPPPATAPPEPIPVRKPAPPVSTAPRASSTRAFVPPGSTPSATKDQNPALPPLPGTEPVITVTTIPALPVGLNAPGNAPAPPPPALASAPPPQAVKPVLPVGGKSEPAQIIKRTLPDYPVIARQRALTGVVLLTAVVNERGDVSDVKVLTGDAFLAAAAKNAVLSWKYKPATLNGRPVASNTEIQIRFGDAKK